MKVTIRAGVLVFLLGGAALAGERPSWWPGGGYAVTPDCPGCFEPSPLYPQFAPWVLQPSYCKMPFCTRARPKHWGEGETPYFPPLPYGHRAMASGGPTIVSAPGQAPPISTAAPAPGAVTAPAPAAAPAAGLSPSTNGVVPGPAEAIPGPR